LEIFLSGFKFGDNVLLELNPARVGSPGNPITFPANLYPGLITNGSVSLPKAAMLDLNFAKVIIVGSLKVSEAIQERLADG